jgi:hypothetical protein
MEMRRVWEEKWIGGVESRGKDPLWEAWSRPLSGEEVESTVISTNPTWRRSHPFLHYLDLPISWARLELHLG